MRSLPAILALINIPALLAAQPKGYEKIPNLIAFQKTLAASTAATQSLQSDFSQVKQLSLMADKISSKGHFFYQKQDKVRIEYTSPFSYLLVMNGGQILVKDEQKSTRINARNSKVMQSVNRIMIDCMRGSVFSNPDFSVTAYQDARGYLLNLVPVSPAVRGIFRQIDVYLGKTGLDVERLTMTEQGGDFTQMDFRNTRKNINLSDALFKVR